MGRLLSRIALCLVLGTVTTVGTTWALAVALNWRTFENYNMPQEGAYPYADVSIRSRFGGTGCYAVCESGSSDIRERFERWLDEQPIPSCVRPIPPHPENLRIWEAAAFGWPFRALSYQSELRLVQEPDIDRPEGWEWKIHGAIQIVRPSGGGLLAGKAPLLPVWPGFALNILFYGALWFGLGRSIGAMRRAIRRRRGHCPQCDYDLRGTTVENEGCPECGWKREEDSVA